MGLWDQRGPREYRLSITIGGRWGECRDRFAVEGDSSTNRLEDGCTAPFGAQLYRSMGSPATIEDLFDYIKTGIESSSCGPNGCRCDGALAIDAIYDADLGYPESIKTYFKRHWTTMPWPLSPEFTQGCTLIGTILPEDVRVDLDELGW